MESSNFDNDSGTFDPLCPSGDWRPPSEPQCRSAVGPAMMGGGAVVGRPLSRPQWWAFVYLATEGCLCSSRRRAAIVLAVF